MSDTIKPWGYVRQDVLMTTSHNATSGYTVPVYTSDALASLLAENERLREDRDNLNDAVTAWRTEVDRLRAELAAAQQDAERYRFIRDANRSDPAICFEDLLMYAEDSLDSAIDAAMQEKRDE